MGINIQPILLRNKYTTDTDIKDLQGIQIDSRPGLPATKASSSGKRALDSTCYVWRVKTHRAMRAWTEEGSATADGATLLGCASKRAIGRYFSASCLTLLDSFGAGASASFGAGGTRPTLMQQLNLVCATRTRKRWSPPVWSKPCSTTAYSYLTS